MEKGLGLLFLKFFGVPLVVWFFGLLLTGFLFFLNPFVLANDYPSYVAKAIGNCVNCENYKPFVIWFLVPFAHLGGSLGIRFGVSLVFGLVSVLLLYFVTGETWSAWFYVSLSSYLTFITTSGVLAQGFVGVLFLLYLVFKSWPAKLVLLFFAFFTHLVGFYALVLVFVVDFLFLKRDLMFAPIGVCSPFWGRSLPNAVNSVVANGGGNVHAILSVNNLLAFFVKIVPVPFLVVAVRELWGRRLVGLLFALVVSFVGAFFLNPRVLYFAFFPMVIGFSLAFKGLSLRRHWLVLSFVQFGMIVFFGFRLFVGC